jgi:DNA polymerase-1
LAEHFYWDYVNKLHQAYVDIERQGWRIDEERRKELYNKYKSLEDKNDKELESLCGRFVNVNSSQGKGSIPDLLYNTLGIPKREGTGEEILVSLLANTVKDETHKKILSLILEQRRIKKTIGTYILSLPDFDYRMRTGYRIVGTESGRTSTSLLKPPVRPDYTINRNGKKVKKSIGVAFQTLTKHGEIGPDIRSMYIPDEDHVFLEIDSSQAEARIVALLAEDYDLLNRFNSGEDIHSWSASHFLSVPLEVVLADKKLSGGMRFIGKEVRHAFAYGMKNHRCMLTINTDARKFGVPVNLSEAEADRLLKKAHGLHPGVRTTFHEGIIDVLKNNRRTLINPYGRIRQHFERWGEDLFGEAWNYIPQSTVRDLVGHAILEVRSKKPSIRIFGESHDALYLHSKIGEEKEDAEIVSEAMSREIDFSKCSLKRDKLRIPCEVMIGRKNLKDMEKYESGR